jgi:hypothetical protein
MPSIRVTRTNRGKRPKLDTKIKMFSEADVKMEVDSDEDYDIKTTAKHKPPATNKKGVVVKRQNNKDVSASQNLIRNSTRVTNKYRLNSKSMFDPSIKEENFIVIEDHSEDVEAGTKKKARKPPLHKKSIERGKKTAPFPTGPVTRATTRLSKAKAVAGGISGIPENKERNLVGSHHISYMPKAMDSTSSYEENSSGLASRYQVKLREPKVVIDLNEPAPAEEFPKFKVKVRTDK